MRYLILAAILTFCHIAATEDDLSVSKLVLGQGYPFEEYEVVTEDGYILSLHRIPFGKNSQGKIGRPVIVQHGILTSSACWVLSSPDQSLGFILADHGYDVWLPNNRGNTYSLKHLTLNPNNFFDKRKYWNFSFHEMGYYDLPAIIDFILNKTNHKKLFYIGYSQGTTQFFALMSTRPEYNEKVIHMSALAPVAFLNHNRGRLYALTYLSDELETFCKRLYLHNVPPPSLLIRWIQDTICSDIDLGTGISKNILLLISGFDSRNVNESKLVLGQGYPFEEYEVVTEDGYILSMHRIPYGKNSKGKIGRPVIVQHGILTSSACWVLSSPDQSLGFILADHGYDVWLPNNRGNTYSLKHLTLDPNNSTDKKKFWDFSFHEMGYYDLPAIIDFILNKTNHKKLFYIGYSQGTTQFFALMSTRPEYNEKVIHMSALAPVAFLNHNRGRLNAFTYLSDELATYCKRHYIHNVPPTPQLIRWIQDTICSVKGLTAICKNILLLITDFDSRNVNETLIPNIMTYTPAGASIKQLIHFSQLAKNGHRFTQFNDTEYDLSKVTTPITLHYSENDWISGVKDVEKLRSQLPNAESILVPSPRFTHLDFMWEKDAWTLLYKPMLEVIRRY